MVSFKYLRMQFFCVLLILLICFLQSIVLQKHITVRFTCVYTRLYFTFDLSKPIHLTFVRGESRAGKCPAAPAAPLPGNVSQNIFAGNFLTPCRKFLSSYILECHIIYLFSLEISKAFCKLIIDIVFKLILKIITMGGTILYVL
jgi:hypothetical protein